MLCNCFVFRKLCLAYLLKRKLVGAVMCLRGLFSCEPYHKYSQARKPWGSAPRIVHFNIRMNVGCNSVATGGWKPQRDFEAVVNEPLEGGQCANLIQ